MTDARIEAALAKSLIALPSVNGGRLLKRMLPTLRVPPELVVVIDQASADDTAEVCAEAGVTLYQAGERLTYTQACNLGAKIARERGAEFLFVGNNDITFTTDVAREMLAEMLRDPKLGIVAPTQIIVNEVTDERHIAYRVHWQLETLLFNHDFSPPPFRATRIEADFCELTFVLVRLAVLDEIGFLDDEYGFYHEDADFCFRLGRAGYSCAYLPHSQIEHFASSSFSVEPSPMKLAYQTKNRKLFASRYQGFGIDHRRPDEGRIGGLAGLERRFHTYLRHHGLVDPLRPRLTVGAVATSDAPFLVASPAGAPPPHWQLWGGQTQTVFMNSAWGVETLRKAGFSDVRYLPVAVEPDVFHPWGPAESAGDGPVVAWFRTDPGNDGLVALLSAWQRIAERDHAARLLMIGELVPDVIGRKPGLEWSWEGHQVREWPDRGLIVVEPEEPLDEDVRARLLRSVDFTVWTGRGGVAMTGAAESMACGTPALIPDHPEMADLLPPGGIAIRGTLGAEANDPLRARWIPDARDLADRLKVAVGLRGEAHKRLSEAGILHVRQHFTWRHAMFALRAALEATQTRGEAVGSNLPQATTARLDNTVGRNAAVARQLRRASELASRFADDLERFGVRHAVGKTSRRIKTFMRKRLPARFSKLGGIVGHTPQSVGRPGAIVQKPGVLFLGYVEAGLGLGESLRGLVRAYSTGTKPFGVYPFREGVETRLIGEFMPETYDTTSAYDVTVLEIATDQVPVVYENLDHRLLADTYVVLRTYWELPAAPAVWKPMLSKVREVWAPNTYVANAFREIFAGPIVVVPPCVEPETTDLPSRVEFGLEDGRFYFLFSFDYYSFPTRKNPEAVIAAFQRAFPDAAERVGLIVKSTGAPDHYPEIKRSMLAAAEADSRIRILDTQMARREIHGLINACDCYVSLHRAEGFGFGMAEAMYFGRPVIATAFSGNADFVTEETAFPVSFTLRPVAADEYVWPAGQVWAEPDLASAVEAFQTVYRDEDTRRRRAAAGSAFVREYYGPAAVRGIAEARVAAITEAQHGAREQP